MNRGQLLTEIGYRLVELKGAEATWQPQERLDALHEAQRRMVKQLRLLRKTSPAATVIGQQDYVLAGAAGFNIGAGNFFGVIRPGLVYYDGTQDSTLTLRNVEWLYEQSPNWRNESNGTPKIYFPAEGGLVFNDTLSLYPKPDKVQAGGLRLHHLLRPADMTDDSHEPFNTVAGTTIQFPSLQPIHYALVWLTVMLLIQDEDPIKAEAAAAQYRERVGKGTAEVFAPDASEHDRGSVAMVDSYRARGRW